MTQPPMAQGRSNDFQTPPEALMPILETLPKGKIVWEPAAGEGNLVNAFKEHGFEVYSSDILDGRDYLTYEPSAWDVAITNPPYSLKDKFLQRAYSLGKPFAFLLPLTTLEGKIRQGLFRQHGVQIIFMPKRINFKTPSGEGQGSWFATAWFTWKWNLPQDLTFWSGS